MADRRKRLEALQRPKFASRVRQPDDPLSDFLALVGSITVMWAKAEGALDEAIDILCENGGRAQLGVVPRNFADKLRYFRKAHRRIAKFTPLLERADACADALRAVKPIRDDLAHAIAHQTAYGDLVNFVKVRRFAGRTVLDRQVVTKADLEPAFASLADANDRMQEHIWHLTEIGAGLAKLGSE